MKSFYTPFFILLGFLSWFPSDTVFAQAPQYNYTPNSITNNAFPLNSSSSNCRQNLYYPADFNAPSGTIDKIYIGGIATSPTFTTLTIKMGPSALTTFTAGPFVSGLTTVFSNTVSRVLRPQRRNNRIHTTNSQTLITSRIIHMAINTTRRNLFWATSLISTNDVAHRIGDLLIWYAMDLRRL